MRDYLTAAVRSAAEGLGYIHVEGTEAAVAGRISSFPALWMEPLRIVASQGCNERSDVYRLTARLLAGGMKLGGEQAELFRILETDAMDLVGQIADKGNVRRVFNIKCTPNTMPVTRHGDCGVTLEMDIRVFGCV